MDELKSAVKKTNNYANEYGQKLNGHQLYLRLISPKIFDFKKVLEENQVIVPNKFDANPTKKNKEWQIKMNLAQKLVNRNLSKIKGIKLVGITGSVAAEAAKKNEDIDLLIVTKEEEMWWWRLYLRFHVWKNKIPHRKFGEQGKENEFCFNLWLDMANLEIPKEKQNLKNATDLIMMKVIYDVDNTYQKFLRENKWVKKYLATGYQEHRKKVRKGKIDEIFFYKKLANTILFRAQYLYMRVKTKNGLENIKRGYAFFHNKD